MFCTQYLVIFKGGLCMARIASAAMNCKLDKDTNIKTYLRFIDEAASKDVDLLVFPELSLQGAPPNIIEYKFSWNKYQQDNAELVPEGPTTQLMIQEAKENNMYICWGMSELSHSHPGYIYNSAVLVGPEGYVGRFRKVHQPMGERLMYHPGNDFPVFETRLGKIGIQICYDKAFPEGARVMAIRGAEIILNPSAWPWSAYPETDCWFTNYGYAFDTMRALENGVIYVTSNQVGEVEGGGHEGGFARIINPAGKVIASTNQTDEGLAIADIDIRQAIADIRTPLGGIECNLLRERRPDAYGAITENDPYSLSLGPGELD